MDGEPTIADIMTALSGINEHLAVVGQRLGALEQGVNSLSQRLDTLEERYGRRFDTMYQRLDRVEVGVEHLLDTLGLFRCEYMHDHPRPEAPF